MISALAFARTGECLEGRLVRASRFKRRSLLPVSAACIVANGVRETLSSFFGQRTGVRLMEPVVPDPHAWSLIAADAAFYRVRGPLSDAALVLRDADALALVSTVFGERAQPPRALSAIEEEVLSRALHSLAATLAPVCGPIDRLEIERMSGRAEFLTYFELLVDGPLEVRLGIALSRDPAPGPHACLRLDDLAEVELELSVEFASGTIEAGELLLLRPETQLRMETKVGAPAALKLAGRTVARGECGALGERNAFVVSSGPKGGDR